MVRAALEKLGIPESSPLVSEFVARYERDRPFSYLEGEKKAQAILDNVRIELRREVQVALRDGRYPAEKTRGLVEFLDREIETAGPGVDGELRYQRKVLAQMSQSIPVESSQVLALHDQLPGRDPTKAAKILATAFEDESLRVAARLELDYWLATAAANATSKPERLAAAFRELTPEILEFTGIRKFPNGAYAETQALGLYLTEGMDQLIDYVEKHPTKSKLKRMWSAKAARHAQKVLDDITSGDLAKLSARERAFVLLGRQPGADRAQRAVLKDFLYQLHVPNENQFAVDYLHRAETVHDLCEVHTTGPLSNRPGLNQKFYAESYAEALKVYFEHGHPSPNEARKILAKFRSFLKPAYGSIWTVSNNGRVLSDLDVKLTRYLEAKVQGFTAWDEVEKRSLSTAAPKQSSADPRCEVGILVQSMLNPN